MLQLLRSEASCSSICNPVAPGMNGTIITIFKVSRANARIARNCAIALHRRYGAFLRSGNAMQRAVDKVLGETVPISFASIFISSINCADVSPVPFG